MRFFCTFAALACLAAPALADDGVATYAIVVGSNMGGPGQANLRYAEDDARRVGKLLTELGGYTSDKVDIVVHPSPDELRARIGKLSDRLAADAKAGRASRVFFYYSGHARAEAIDLGKAQLPLAELRQRLFELPSKLTVVVLDACQSGAFSRVKGAAPAADFSFNSRTQLDATGVAVLASSSGSELSQESEQLKGSYFTHHLLVGLRGASDTNRDGLVTVDEAYRYAYNQTLLATAETAVGGQHVSLEVDLKGHGEVPLSFPRAATKSIELPASLEGKTLVEDTRAKSVVAETYKAKGAAVRIAVADGDYRVLVRQGTTLSRCEVSAGGIVELSRCKTEQLVDTTAKGGEQKRHPFRLQVGGQIGGERHDEYTNSLEAFGYREQNFLDPTSTAEVMLLRGSDWTPFRDSLGIAVGHSSMPSWVQDISGSDFQQRFDWSITHIHLVSRFEKEFAETGFFSHLGLYIDLNAGLGIGRTSLTDADSMKHRDTYFGLSTRMGVGLHVDSPIPIAPGIGFDLGWAAVYSPVINDLIGNTHTAGGQRLAAALTYDL